MAYFAEKILKNQHLEVDKKIMADIYTSSEPMDNLEVLCDIYGSRFPGTRLPARYRRLISQFSGMCSQ